MDQADRIAKARRKRLGAIVRRGEIGFLALLDERAYPIGLPPGIEMPAERIDDVGQPILGDDACFDGLAARRHLVEPALIHFAILREREGARDRRRGHRQKVRRVLRLGLQHHALRNTEAVLLVHHDEAQILVTDRFLKDRMRADEDVDRSIRKPHQHAFPHATLVAAGEHRDRHGDAGEQALQRLAVLAGQDLRRREECGLRARLHRDQHRHRRDQRLARADIALKQAKHRLALLQVALDFPDRARLRAGRRIGQSHGVPKPTIADERATTARA